MSQMTATVEVGTNCVITVSAENAVDLIKALSQFSQLPASCGFCNSPNISFACRSFTEEKNYDFLHMVCSACGAQCDIGQRKNPRGSIYYNANPNRSNVSKGFYKLEEQDFFKKARAGGQSQDRGHELAKRPRNNDGFDDNEDIPF